MPKYYAYKSSSGGYIQTQIDDAPQTLQVAPSAERLLSELGYDYDEYVPRDVTKPLVIVGVLRTKPYGRSKFDLLDGMPALATDYCELTTAQQSRLRDYLRERIDDLSADEYEYLRDFLAHESPLEPIPRSETASEDPTNEAAAHTELETCEAVNIDAIPTSMRALDQWICWRIDTRNGKETKIPVSPHDGEFASVDDPSTWAELGVAVEAADRDDVDGLGFVFTDDDTIAGVDLDDMRTPETGELSDRARDIISTLDSYTEVSPSGTGVHVLVQGFIPEGRSRHAGVELYDDGRFFTVTGDHLDETPPEIKVRHTELGAVHAEYVAEQADSDGAGTEPEQPSETPPSPDTDLTVDEIIEYGKRTEKFRRLWNGDISEYPSQSEADLALCIYLAYFTGDDKALMDAVFRRSSLMRDKWDEMRGDQTYGEMTLEKAIREVDSFSPRLHGIEAASPQVEIAALETGETATIKATVDEVESVPIDEIEQAGELTDGMGRIRFVVWQSDYWDPELQLQAGTTYRLAEAWVTEHQGQREVHINEHTAIEEV